MSQLDTILKLKEIAETLIRLDLFQHKITKYKNEISIKDIDEIMPEFVLSEENKYEDLNFPKLDINKKELRKTGYIDEFDYFIYLHTVSAILASKKEKALEFLYDKGLKQQQYHWIQIYLLRALLDIAKEGINTKIILDKIVLNLNTFESLVKGLVLDKLSEFPKTKIIDTIFSIEIEKNFNIFLKKKEAWRWCDVHSDFHRLNKYDSQELKKYFVIMEDMCLGRFDNQLKEFQHPEKEENEFEIMLYNLCKAIIGLMYFKVNQSNSEVNEILKRYLKKGKDKETRKAIKKELKRYNIKI